MAANVGAFIRRAAALLAEALDLDCTGLSTQQIQEAVAARIATTGLSIASIATAADGTLQPPANAYAAARISSTAFASTVFSGWWTPIGAPPTFDTVQFVIIPFNASYLPQWARVIITGSDYNSATVAETWVRLQPTEINKPLVVTACLPQACGNGAMQLGMAVLTDGYVGLDSYSPVVFPQPTYPASRYCSNRRPDSPFWSGAMSVANQVNWSVKCWLSGCRSVALGTYPGAPALNSTTFTGGGFPLGVVPIPFNRLEFDIVPFDVNYPTSRLRCRIRNNDYQGAIVGDCIVGVLTPLPLAGVYTLTLGTQTSGTFTLTYGGQTTSPIAYNAIASTIQAALEALSGIGSGNINVTGSGPFTLTFVGTLRGTSSPLTANFSSLGTPGNASLLAATAPGSLHVVADFDATIDTATPLWMDLLCDGRAGIIRAGVIYAPTPTYAACRVNSTGYLQGQIGAISATHYNVFVIASRIDRNLLRPLSGMEYARRLRDWIGVPASRNSTGSTAAPPIVKLSLPDRVYAVEGRECNIYFDNILRADFPVSEFQIDVTCTKGTQQKERWTFTPVSADAGTYSLQVDAYWNGDYTNKVATATTSLVVKPLTNGNGVSRKVLLIGDSTGAGWTAEVANLFADAGGTMAATFIGVRHSSVSDADGLVRDMHHEAIGGYKYELFDQYQLYESGGCLTNVASRLTGLTDTWVSREQYDGVLYYTVSESAPTVTVDLYRNSARAAGDRVATGTLGGGLHAGVVAMTPVNGSGVSGNLTLGAPYAGGTRTGYMVVNWFINPTTGLWDLNYYLATYGLSMASGDWLLLSLGINECLTPTTDDALSAAYNTASGYLANWITRAKAAVPGIRIGVLNLIPPAADQDGFGANYGSGMTRWRYKRNRDIWRESIVRDYAGRTAESIYLVDIGLGLDAEHNMQSVSVAVNSRNATTVSRSSNGVHPPSMGYYQIADQVYSNLKAIEA